MSENKMVIPLLGAPGTELTDTSLKQNLTDSKIQTDSVLELYERFKPDAMLPFMDLTVEAEALGLELKFPENDNPAIKFHPVQNREDFERIKDNWNGISGRMPVYIDVVKNMKARLPEEVKKYAYVIGPITLAGELMGVAEAAEATIEQPELISEILDFSVEVISEYSNALFDAGADALCVLEPTAVLLSPRSYKKNSQRPFKNLAGKVGGRPLILHVCGDTQYILKGMCDSGAAGLSLDTPMNFPEIAKKIPEEIMLIGNIDPVGIILESKPEEVEKTTLDFVKQMKGVDNFVLSTGCDIPLRAPMENLEAFMKVGKMWKKGKV
ncbi:MAG: uroporphyrinogen decarboxylase family protein [Victivallales bacterium]|nr:uroporphyrinogen decarboxylase family protein [Victivallales bacterium]MCF7888786.1 uroporphyrinogen decarboxylase family protein [Victivallales bacterium]